MRRILEAMEEGIAQSVPVLFFLALATGTIFYFIHDVQFDSPLSILGAVAASAMALGLVGFSYSQQVRFRVAWRDVNRQDAGTDEYEKARRQLTVNLRILCVVVAVDMANCFAFWVTLRHPAGWYEWFDVGFRVVVFPVLYILSGFMVKVRLDAAELLGKAVDKNTVKAVRMWTSQLKRRINNASKAGRDLTPAVTTLLMDEGDTVSARRVNTIVQGLNETEGVKTAKLYSSQTRSTPGPKASPFDYPVLPGTGGSKQRHGSVIDLVNRKRRRVVKKTPQQRVFDYLEAHKEDATFPSISDIQKATKVSKPTAIQYREKWLESQSISLAQ